MVLYHGTSIIAWNNIKTTKIDALINAETELDFGHGFYASFEADKRYAEAHGLKTVRNNIGKYNARNNTVLIKFEVDESLFSNKKIFPVKNDEFLEFVFNMRYNYLNEQCSYDVIEGPMADGYVDGMMSLHKKYPKIFSKRLVKACYNLPFNMHKQIVIKSQEICDKITVLSVTTLKGDVLYEKKEN